MLRNQIIMYQNISLEVKGRAKEDLLALQFLGCIPYPLDKTFSLRFVDPFSKFLSAIAY